MIPGCLWVALSAAGCLRSTGLRTSATPEVSPSNLQSATDPGGSSASSSIPLPATQILAQPPVPPVVSAAPVQAPNPTGADEPALAAAPASSALSVQASPAPSPTPLLDEALERVNAVNRERIEVQAAERLPKPIKIPEPVTPAPVATEPVAPAPSLPPEPTQTVEPPAQLPDLLEIKPTDSTNEKPAETSQPGKPDPEPATKSAADSPPDQAKAEPSLKIAELKLCRRVEGFGSFSPLDTPLKPGSLVLVYCEMAGIGYEARGDSFVSRITSRISIRSSGDGRVVWERDMGIAEDVCRKERRDYYVTYRVLMPSTLAPGSYVLDLAQTDLLTKQTTSANLALTVVE